MCIRNAVLFAVSSSVMLFASEKPDFSGKWRIETPGSGSAVVLSIDQNDRELRISSAPDQKDVTEIVCNTMGKECESLVNGERVRVSYWYNGPMLVEMVFEGKGNDPVTETRRTLSEDGQKMLVEIIPIVPSGRSREKLVFVREQAPVTTATATEQK